MLLRSPDYVVVMGTTFFPSRKVEETTSAWYYRKKTTERAEMGAEPLISVPLIRQSQ